MAKAESAPTQQFVDIKDIRDDVLLLKTGGLRKILLVSGVNIELKSEEEQNIIYYEYQNLLNSLEFSIQLVVHSRKLNIDGYLKLLEERENEEMDELLKNEVSEYRAFIKSFVAENDIMSKNFFVVIPYDPATIESARKVSSLLPSILPTSKIASQRETLTTDEEDEFAKNLFQLNQRVDHLVSALHTIGIRAVPLNRDELAELFYNLYNPETTEKKDVTI